MKRLYEMHGEGHSARAIARELGLARNTVLKYLRSPEAVRPKPRRPRGSNLDPYAQHIDRRWAEGLENCVVLLRELRALGYEGAYSTLTEYLRPRRRGGQPEATMRFETAPGEQAQVDWGSLGYVGVDGEKHRIWAFVMTMGWSRACYAELVRKADTATFIQCHASSLKWLHLFGIFIRKHPKERLVKANEAKRETLVAEHASRWHDAGRTGPGYSLIKMPTF